MVKKIEVFATKRDGVILVNVVPGDASWKPSTLVVHDNDTERVFTASEVISMLAAMNKEENFTLKQHYIIQSAGIAFDPA